MWGGQTSGLLGPMNPAQIQLYLAGTLPYAMPAHAAQNHARDAGAETVPVVFIVDDDEAVRSALRVLVRSLGWEARTFGQGRALLDEHLPEHNACILVDLNMPDMNGAEVLERLRAQGSRLPVIGFTGERDSPLIRRLQAAGAKTVLFKPIHDEALRVAIAGALAPC